ncbi:MAG: hypothetical protein ABS69_09800 [Nitrosomonadales bacterium SCN 54-20]|nr:MAG: hypothetical protein ABS69_09800 [Nitrosomonadales bacterium SCN 54-20]
MQIHHGRFISTLLAGLLLVAPAAHTQPIISLQGKVATYLINPFGEIDGLILDNGTLAKTPPHMSSNVTEFVKPGDSVTLQGTPKAGPSFETYSITNMESNQILLRREPSWNEKPMPKHLRAVGLKEISTAGKIQQVIAGKHGEPKIVILDNGANVRLPKEAAYAAFSHIRMGAPFAASGYGTENQYGRSLEATAVGSSLASLQPLFPAPAKPR